MCGSSDFTAHMCAIAVDAVVIFHYTHVYHEIRPDVDRTTTTPTAAMFRVTGGDAMETRIDEIASGIYRLSTVVPEIAPPSGFIFNQFLLLGDAPLLFHTG